MIVFAACIPHSPLLIPAIGKRHREKLVRTIEAYDRLRQRIASVSPEAFVIISPHVPPHAGIFTINVAQEFQASLSEFGDYATKASFLPDFDIIGILQHASKDDIHIGSITEPTLDHGTSIPLLLLTEYFSVRKITSVGTCDADAVEHYKFGKILGDELKAFEKRIAVIASADFSHCLSSESPQGLRPEGAIFDDRVRNALNDMDTKALLKLPKRLLEKSCQCGYRPLLVLLGALTRYDASYREYAYEHPFGIGYLSAEFIVKDKDS